MRLFVAADLPAGIREQLAGIQDRLRDLPLPVRWVRPEGIHLTFVFLGEVQEGRRSGIEAALRRAVPGFAPFRLEAGGVGAFPDHGPPRVLWVGVRGQVEAAGALQRALEEALRETGVALERRGFKPHLTLGRVRGPGVKDWRAALGAVAPAEVGAFEVRELVLFGSRLTPEGGIYTPLARFPLDARGAP